MLHVRLHRTDVGEGVRIAGLPVAARHEAERVPLRLAEECDVLVSQRQQVGRDPAPVVVIDDDARQRRVRRVDQDDRELCLSEPSPSSDRNGSETMISPSS